MLNKIILNEIALKSDMKSLKNYIKYHINENYLDESVWDIEDNVESDNKELILNEIKKFIEDNYYPVDINRCELFFEDDLSDVCPSVKWKDIYKF